MSYFVLAAFHFSALTWLLIGLTEMSLSCPIGCECNDLEVKCIGQSLRRIPTTIPLPTKKLNLANNKITYIKQLELSYLNDLIYLDLNHNVLNLSYPFAFPDMDHLSYLDLSYNNISFITAFTFRQLKKLLLLNLSGNRSLKEIQLKTFDGNTMLRYLDLNNCGLTYLSGKLFGHMHNLHRIGLYDNPWVCDCDFLEFCTWLREAAVIYTDVTEVVCLKPELFHGLTFIQAETKLHFDCLVHLENLDFLYISLIAFLIFLGGTFVAWLVGVSSVIYSHFIVVKMDEDSEDEEQKMI